MSKNKIYAVAVGRKKGLYNSWSECKEQVDGFPNAKYKGFDSEQEASAYLKTTKVKRKKICLLCQKPMSVKTELCYSCIKKKKQLIDILFEYSNGRITKVSNRDLVRMQNKYNKDNIIDYLIHNPSKYCTDTSFKNRIAKIEKKQYLKNNTTYVNEDNIPRYIVSLFGSTKEVLKVSGNKENPNIIYKCKRCGEVLYTRYDDYLKSSGHNCDSIKSSGELIVEEYLKRNKIPYKAQYETLKCLNPDTSYIMPYDFELIGKRIIIEVQGEQHRSFIPVFHITEEGFEYQKLKDKYKREYAEQKGYKVIEIWYEDFKDNSYINKINTAIKK